VKVVVLFLGNPIFRDDAVGIEVGKRLMGELEKMGIDMHILEKTGLSLLDYIHGYDMVIIVDGIRSNKHPVGHVYELDGDLMKSMSVFSPHYAGLPEALMAIHALELLRPNFIHIIAIETKDPYTIGDNISLEISEKLDSITKNVFDIIMKITRRGDHINCNQS